MHFVVAPKVKAGRNELTTAQRTSSFFSETPRVAGQILRRGQSIVLSEAQLKLNELHLRRMMLAGAIEITAVLDSGQKIPLNASMTVVLPKEEAAPAPVNAEPVAKEEAAPAEAAPESAPEPEPAPAEPVEEAVAPSPKKKRKE
jgi:hypothetical protein